MDTLLLLFGVTVAIAILTTGGFGLLGDSPLGFNFFSSGPLASGPGGGGLFDFGSGIFGDSTDSVDSVDSIPTGEIQGATYDTGKIEITSVQNSSIANEEYVVIRNDTRNRISLYGWSIGNTEGKRYPIGTGSKLALQGSASPVTLEPDAEAYIHTGRSAIGQGFLENGCFGYISNHYNFTHSVSNSCYDVPMPTSRNFNDQCLQYLERFSGSCEIPTPTADDYGLSYDCQEYARLNYGYQTCVERNRNRNDFYGETWHLYLDRPTGLWRSYRDVITLYDGSGNVIDTYEY